MLRNYQPIKKCLYMLVICVVLSSCAGLQEENSSVGKDDKSGNDLYDEGKFVLNEHTLSEASKGRLTYIPFEIGTDIKEVKAAWGEPDESGNIEGKYLYYKDRKTYIYMHLDDKVSAVGGKTELSRQAMINILGRPSDEFESDLSYVTGDYFIYITGDTVMLKPYKK
ncbi:YjgB family protein [Mechercharimyces sp. CAU 1602]|uniref:YjgB family protein n=1 Tax=Mechercharimyces sp. CAU 1602 TaxID=2973933 RepID=UPI002162DEDC|nr:YjgB family protein [Mechercharimyces sp. CAU 1602]MCS1352445.1 YjgB family protein [Mechercharimyces sp. CAU 1602]